MARRKKPIVTSPWISSADAEHPMVLSSRARLFRNIEGLPFPSAATAEDLERARGMVLETVSKRVANDRDWDMIFAEELDREQFRLMKEAHLVDRRFLERPRGRALALSWQDGRSVTVNGEESVIIQATLPADALHEAYRAAGSIDDLVGKELHYSFDPELGYLTANPANVGTGLRISALLHLPALTIRDEIDPIVKTLDGAGIAMRGMYGEHPFAAGNLFTVSNRQTIGRSEEGIVSWIASVVRQVVEQERTVRKMLLREVELELSDKIYRALGVLERARKIGFHEAMEMASLVRLGLDMELVHLSAFNIAEVGVLMGPAHIRNRIDNTPEEEEIDRERAVRLRAMLRL